MERKLEKQSSKPLPRQLKSVKETAQDLCRDDDGDDGGDGGKKIVSLARDPREEMFDMIANLS